MSGALALVAYIVFVNSEEIQEDIQDTETAHKPLILPAAQIADLNTSTPFEASSPLAKPNILANLNQPASTESKLDIFRGIDKSKLNGQVTGLITHKRIPLARSSPTTSPGTTCTWAMPP